MAGQDAARGLNENHRRALTSTLSYIEQLLSDIERAAASDDASPFAPLTADLSPTQRQVVGDYLARIRAQMADALTALSIAPPARRTSASWAIQTALTFVSIALQDSSPSRLRGYGRIDEAASALVGRIEADLDRTVTRLRHYLAQGLGRDLAERIARLEKTAVDVTLVRTLERVITERGLVELRGPLESLLEQLETDAYEIAVFGRVSAGKSSLLNAVLEIDALPVGVTPVTAVPTRVTWDDRAHAEIKLAEQPVMEVPLAQLVDFVSEASNPENRKRVERITVRVPSPRLRAGIVFVDTPGVGALAAHGARASYAYLPRCDLGIVLLDAGGSPSPEDFELLLLLYDSAIPGMIVVSKCDLLDEPDRRRLRSYLQAQLAQALDLALPIHFVSTRGAQAVEARRWFADEVQPLCERSRELAAASVARKLGNLREAVVAALRIKLGRRPNDGAHAQEVDLRIQRLAEEVEAQLLSIERRCEASTDAVRKLAPEALARGIRLLVDSTSPTEAAAILARAIVTVANEAAARLRQTLLDARGALGDLLRQMSAIAGMPVEAQLQLDLLGMPSLTLPAAVETFRPPERGFAWFRERRLRDLVERQLLDPLERAFSNLGADWRVWNRAVIAQLSEQTAASSEPLRAHARRLTAPPINDEADEAELADDLRQLAAQSP